MEAMGSRLLVQRTFACILKKSLIFALISGTLETVGHVTVAAAA